MGFITDNITASTITITSGATDGYVLKSNNYGDATWQLPVITDNLTIQGDGTTNNPLSTTPTISEQVVLFADLATTEPLKPCTYNNGTLGVGATLTGNAPGQLSTISFSGKVDNTTTAVGQIILVRAQPINTNNPALGLGWQNGLYEVTTLGDATTPFVLTRTTDADTQAELYPLQINIFGGATQANLSYLQKTIDPIVGTSNIQFTTTVIGITNPPLLHVDTTTSAPLPACTYFQPATNPSLPASGAYLESNFAGVLGTINGVNMTSGRRILVKDEVNQVHNGVYNVAVVGSASTKWKLVRADVWGSTFVYYAREWKVNNPTSTKYGARYSTNLASLSNTQVGVVPITFFEAPAGTGITVGSTPVTLGTDGRVFFQESGVIQQDGAFFWDNTNKRLGVGATPSTSVRLDVRTQGTLSTDIAFRVRNSGDTDNITAISGDGSFKIGLENGYHINLTANSPSLRGQVASAVAWQLSPWTGEHSWITSNSNNQIMVGIGTTSPTDKLHIYNTVNDYRLRISVGAGTPSDESCGIRFTTTYAGTSFGADAANLVIRTKGTSFVNTQRTTLEFRMNALGTSNLRASITSQSNLLLQSPIEDTNDVGVIYIPNGTAPTTSITGGSKFYSADITAGNAAPHFRTENGSIVKLYQETTGVTSSTYTSVGGSNIQTNDTFDGYTIPQIVKALKNLGILS